MGSFFRGGLRDRFGPRFGSILEVFWTDFKTKFGVILEAFFSKNVVLPAWELIFQKLLCFSLFICCWRAAQKQQFYLHGSSIFENLLVISVAFFGNAEIVKKCGFPVFLFLYFEQGRGGKKRRQDSGADFWFIFETWSMFFQLLFHLLAWSRPRRRRGRRPLQ